MMSVGNEVECGWWMTEGGMEHGLGWGEGWGGKRRRGEERG